MKNEIDLTEEILSNLMHLKKPSLSSDLLDKIESQLDIEIKRVIPLKQIKRLMIAASILLAVNTVAIVYNLNSTSSSYLVEGESSSLISDFKIYK